MQLKAVKTDGAIEALVELAMAERPHVTEPASPAVVTGAKYLSVRVWIDVGGWGKMYASEK